MRIRWRNFELPGKVVPEAETLTPFYGKFVVEPFERGFGHTIGNGLRRVLLSSIEGAAVTAVRITGAEHEFSSIEGVYEDVTDIVLNVKRLRIQLDGGAKTVARIKKKGKGPVTGADVHCEGEARVMNPELHIATLTKDREFQAELEVETGRGYVTAEENVKDGQQIGTIPVDSIYSPVQRVRYSIEATRVGKFTNYDRLLLEIWTDGTIAPQLALIEAAKIYRKHLNPFVLFETLRDARPVASVAGGPDFAAKSRAKPEVEGLLDRPIADLELSVRARNCLDSANMRTVRELVTLPEPEVANLKNLGKTSLQEIKARLEELGLTLGMKV